ncbi:hypothetical protein [Qipengyuania sp. MTN3-11]|uniref:hypothetical protein n=1 Tax=Qipengyuania sp. MTN3-11 TaxID=3056557 RepID=UPI0036F316CB
MAGRSYLAKPMLRRLLACLALVTGLAAVGAPAHAQLLDALDQLEISADRNDRDKPAVTPCEQRQQEQRQRGERPSPCPPERTIRIYIPSVMLGPDRALE